jgi:hypothetical protein
MTLLAFMALFAEFRGPSWDGWRAILARLTIDVREFYAAVGRGAGKSRVVALLACFFATRQYTRVPGEFIYIGVFAPDRKQAGVTFKYIVGLLKSVPALAALIVSETQGSIELANGVIVEVITASTAAPRGRAYALAIVEEAAFLPQDQSANPDIELVRALRPALARVPGSLLAVVGSPYARRGVLFAAAKQHRDGADPSALFVQAATLDLNPTFDRQAIAKAQQDDPASAAAEYFGQFRSDVEAFISHEAIEAVVIDGRRELPPMPGRTYIAHFDAAGGSGADSQTLAIAHAQDQNDQRVGVLDAIREARPPFSPEAIVKDFAELLHAYKITELQSDRWGGTYPIEAFAKHGIRCKPSSRSSSEFFRDFLPLVNSERLELLDHPRLIGQLAALERRTSRGGKDTISHPPSGHDDLAVVCAAVLTRAGAEREPMRFYFPGEASRSLSTDELQRLHDERSEAARAESAERIRNQIARSGAYFPSDPF